MKHDKKFKEHIPRKVINNDNDNIKLKFWITAWLYNNNIIPNTHTQTHPYTIDIQCRWSQTCCDKTLKFENLERD